MIRCETVSCRESFDDTEFKKLRDTVRELFPLFHEKAQFMTFSYDCWVYKLPGKDQSRNMMVMSHHDVVAGTGEWKHPPFAAEIADGKLWGRGTVDTKTPLFAEFTAFEELLGEASSRPATCGSPPPTMRRSAATASRWRWSILKNRALNSS